MAKSTKNKKSVQSLDELYLDAIVADQDEQIGDDDALGFSASDASVASAGVDKDLEVDNLDFSEEAKKSWQHKGLKSSADHMTLTLWAKGGGQISRDNIKLGLEKLGVTYGIDEAALQQAEELSQDPHWCGEIVVARGSEPEVSRRINYVAMQKNQDANSKGTWLVDGVDLDFEELQDILSVDDLSVFNDSALMVKAVQPGERLVEIIENPNARPGCDIFGSVLEVIAETIPVCGANVRFNEKNRCIEPMLFGYLLLTEDIVSVQLPVWMQPDHLAAFYINFPQIGTAKYPTAKDVFNILVLMGINKRCVSAKNIKLVCENIAAGDKSKIAKIAEAVQPITGKDADFSLAFDTEKKAGTEREDGSIDLRERKSVVSVKAGQMIAEKILPTNGISGVTLLGKVIKALDGKDKKINYGSGVCRKKSIEKIQYYAEIDGNVHFVNNNLTVVDVMKVDGDVDYETGNLDVNTDLEITGSVVAGFTVKSKGSVFIRGSIENGATVVAGDELVVQKGIIGEDTRVISMGNLQVGFIQEAEVLAKGNVVIKSYLYNSRLRANGSITVLKGQGKRSGRVVGGVCCSSKSIVTCYAGSTSSSGTLLSIQPDPELSGNLKKNEDQLQACNGKITKITRSLPFDSFDTKQIKEFLVKIPASQRQAVVQLLNTLNKLIKLQKSIREKRDILNGQVAFALQHGVITVSAGIFQGTDIEFGQTKLVVNSDLGEAVYNYNNGKISTENW